jgi:hypothetical protein
MSFALSLAWRLLLAVALVASPILGLASEGGCAHAPAQVDPAPADIAHAMAMPDAMPGCEHMADMAAKAPHGKPQAPHAPQGVPAHDGGCTSNACCLGGAVGMAGIVLVVDASPASERHAAAGDSLQPAPPRGSPLRPPIA